MLCFKYQGVTGCCSPISLCHGHRGAHRTDWSRSVSTPVLPPLVFGALFRVPSCEQPFPRPSGRKGLSLQLASSPGSNLLPPCLFLRAVREEGVPICLYFNTYKPILLCHFPAEGAITSARGRSLPDTPLTSTPSSVTATSGGERTAEPAVDTSTGNSAPASASTSSLDIVLLLSSVTEPRRQRDISQSNAGLIELPTKPLPVFPPGVSVPSSSPSASGGLCGFLICHEGPLIQVPTLAFWF